MYGVERGKRWRLLQSLTYRYTSARRLCVPAPIFTPVSYTHLDVYKRQVLNEEQGIKELRDKRIAYGISQGKLAVASCLLYTSSCV